MRQCSRMLWLGVLAIVLPTSHAWAGSGDFSIGRFDPSPAGDRMLGVSGPGVGGHLDFNLKLTSDYAHNPLVMGLASSPNITRSIAQSTELLNLGISLGLWQRVSLSADLVMGFLSTGLTREQGSANINSDGGVHLGDLRLGARVLLYNTMGPAFQISAGGFLWVPTHGPGNTERDFIGDSFVRGKLELLLGGETERWFWAVTPSVDMRKHRTFYTVHQGTMLRLNAGGGVFPLTGSRAFSLGVQANAAFMPFGIDSYNTNAEFLVEAHYRILDRWDIGVGGGPGITAGMGTPDYRVVASLGFMNTRAKPQNAVPPAQPLPTLPLPAPLPVPEPILEPLPMIPLEPPKVTVTAHQIVLLEQIQFATNSAQILPQSDAVLMGILDVIKQLPESGRYRIEGHTDSVGSIKRNRVLSLKRSESVIAWLVAHGMAENKFEAQGLGSDKPIADNDTAQGRTKNRRVEIHIIPASEDIQR